jgi:hypothetical protein
MTAGDADRATRATQYTTGGVRCGRHAASLFILLDAWRTVVGGALGVALLRACVYSTSGACGAWHHLDTFGDCWLLLLLKYLLHCFKSLYSYQLSPKESG